MPHLPSPHGDKLKALLDNNKLPAIEHPRVEEAIRRYEDWRSRLLNVHGSRGSIILSTVDLLNEYRRYLDINLIFDSPDDFLYRQKGQLKIDNSVIEEFLPIFITSSLADTLTSLDANYGPTDCISGIRFESSLIDSRPGGAITFTSKDQDFAISKKLYVRASNDASFTNAVTTETNIAYVAAECKTNLDKTMFQEAAATALNLKTVVPWAKYYLLCEWLDMTPINKSTTSIDEILVLRKYKRISANVRERFNTAEGRSGNRSIFVNYLNDHPFAVDTFTRFVNHIDALLHNDGEETVLQRGYF